MMQDTDFGIEFGFGFETQKEVPPATETGRNVEKGSDHKGQSVKP